MKGDPTDPGISLEKENKNFVSVSVVAKDLRSPNQNGIALRNRIAPADGPEA